MPLATITSKGQVTIPKSIREHLGVGPGDRIVFRETESGEVVVEPATVDVMSLRGMFKASRHVSLEEMDEAVRRGGTRT